MFRLTRSVVGGMGAIAILVLDEFVRRMWLTPEHQYRYDMRTGSD